MSKSTSAKNISAFADLVKVSRKNTSFDFCSTNIIELTHKIFYLHAIIISAPFMKFVRGVCRPLHALSNAKWSWFFLT